MDCKRCDELLEGYRCAVDTFKTAVEKGRGAVGDDGCVAANQAAHLADRCKEAGDSLMEHWRMACARLAMTVVL